MPQVNESTPLLVASGQPRPVARRPAWQYVLACALGLGVLCLFQPQRRTNVNVADVLVSLDAVPTSTDADEVAFRSTLETFKDVSMDPCVDFYQYACGGWLKTHDLPVDRPRVDSSFSVVSERNKRTLQTILDQNPPQIGPLYQSCLRGPAVDMDAVHLIASYIADVHLANSTLDLMTVAGGIDQALGISTFFRLSVDADPQDPRTNVLHLAQGGLTLPSREYYLDAEKVHAYASLYLEYVTKVFAVEGLEYYNASEFADAVLEIETSLATISLPAAALRNPLTTSTAYPFPEIATRYPFLMAYLNGIYQREPFPMLHAIIATPSFFEAQNKLLHEDTRLPQLKHYVSFHLLDSLSAVLGEDFRRAGHAFHGAIQGTKALLPRDQFCERLTTGYLGNEVGKYYMQQVFGPDAKATAQALVTEIEESLKALLLTETWLDKLTYEAAVEKLKHVNNYIGGPDVVPPLPFELKADAFFDNMKKLLQRNAADTIQAISKPVDKQAWGMYPSTVNAYYDPSANTMVFPAAILQPPFYSAEHFPAAANFARIGMVMAHELSHGFDDQGRNYDADGKIRSWWTPSVSAQFVEKAQCLAAQYSSFPVVSSQDGHVLGMVNGNLTLGENIADNGGIRLAYEAYHMWKSTVVVPPVVPPNTTPISPEQPTGTDPGKPIPVVVPPVVPVPAVETPKSTPKANSGDVPGPIASPPPDPQPNEDGPEKVTSIKATPAPAPKKTPATVETTPTPVPPVASPPSKIPGIPPDVPDLPKTPQPPVPPAPPLHAPDQKPVPAKTEPPPAAPIVTPPPTKSPGTPSVVPDIPQPPVSNPQPALLPPSKPVQTPASPATKSPAVVPVVTPPPNNSPSSSPVVPDVADTPSPPVPPVIPPPPVQTPPPTIVPRPQPTPEPTPVLPETKPPAQVPAVIPPHTAVPSSPPVVPDTQTPSVPQPPVPTPPPATSPPQAKPRERPSQETSKRKRPSERDNEGKHNENDSESDIHGGSDSNGDEKRHKQEDSEKENERDEKSPEEKHDEKIKDTKEKHNKGGKEDKKAERHRHGDSGSTEEDSHRYKKHHNGFPQDEKDGGHNEKHRRKEEDEDSELIEEHNGERNRDKHKEDKEITVEERLKNEDSHKRKKHGKSTEEDESSSRHEKKHRYDDEDEDHEEDESNGHPEKRHLYNDKDSERIDEHKEPRDKRKEDTKEAYHLTDDDLHRHKKHSKSKEDESDGHHEKKDRYDDEEEDNERYEKHHHALHKHRGHRGKHGHERYDHHKHHHDHVMDWKVVETKYPFSHGDARIHTMVEKLARALVQPVDPVAEDRLFFTAFAQNWCEKSTPEYAELLQTIDPHSPGKWRVNGPLMNYDKFATTFSCPVGTPMNPEKKCVIW